ncbi:hypothetical protein L873DRAFT_1795769 [Choiromyces venosus 120613-1]|uniref:Uncharacterized protein n=1 Tax=Choiromyces venosus 120613-1 TaxID=1336337 RepID=A0A3N4IYB6_9PEZI|nr:hypothetical protein L873DRAFT_1795769 [Choiromyces venosus 120613-1]
MTIVTCFTTLLLAIFLLLCTITLAAPADTTISTIKAPEFAVINPWLNELMQSIPLLPNPENATSLAASRKLIEDAIIAFNLKNPVTTLGEEEVDSASHRICETSGASPRLTDAIAAARIVWDGDRCRMTRRCTEFATWGEGAVGACARGFQLWDFNCKTLWNWLIGICWGCSQGFDGVDRTGGRFVFDDGSGSDVRVYRN